MWFQQQLESVMHALAKSSAASGTPRLELEAVSKPRLRLLVALCAYRWLDGPWTGTYTRLGYDPRAREQASVAKPLQLFASNYRLLYLLVRHARASGRGRWRERERTRSGGGDEEEEQDMGGGHAPGRCPDPSRSPYCLVADHVPISPRLRYHYADLHFQQIQELVHRNDGQVCCCYCFGSKHHLRPTIRSLPFEPMY